MIVPLDLGYVNYYSTQPQNPETPVMFKVALIFTFYIPWKRQTTSGFLIFLRGKKGTLAGNGLNITIQTKWEYSTKTSVAINEQ